MMIIKFLMFTTEAVLFTGIPVKELREMKKLKVLHLENNPLAEDNFLDLKGFAADGDVKVFF
jgi:hypothetical protein